MVKNAVEIKDVCVKFNKYPILHDIDLIIKNNDFLAIIGPNAGGKSTLLKVILGLVKVDQGTVKVFGESPGKPSNPIGYLPQHVSFDPDFPINVFDTVLFGRYHGFFQKYSDLDHEKVKRPCRGWYVGYGIVRWANYQEGRCTGFHCPCYCAGTKTTIR